MVARDANGRPATGGGRPPALIALDPPPAWRWASTSASATWRWRWPTSPTTCWPRSGSGDGRGLRRRGGDVTPRRPGRRGCWPRPGPTRSRIVGVGMGTARARSTARGRRLVGDPARLGGLTRRAMEQRLGLPVQVRNDANLGALAEHPGAPAAARRPGLPQARHRHRRRDRHRRPAVRGAGGTAGEIGHTTSTRRATSAAAGTAAASRPTPRAAAIASRCRRSLGEELTSTACSAGRRRRRRPAGARSRDAGRHIGVAWPTSAIW